MQIKLKYQTMLALLCVLAMVVLLFVDSSAQQRRRRRPSRRSTHPIAQGRNSTGTSMQTDSPEIISTDDPSANGPDNNAQPNNGTRNRNRAAAGSSGTDSGVNGARRSDNKTSADMTRLSDKLNRIEEQQRSMVDLERLSRAEQRAENLRAQLRDVVARQSDLQARAESLDLDLQPENIERSLATVGSIHPEELRAQRRRQLEGERTRVRNQLDLLDKNRASLETSIASADTEAERLRQRVDAANATNAAPQTSATPQTSTTPTTGNSSSQTGTAGATASPSPTPSPSPSNSRPPR